MGDQDRTRLRRRLLALAAMFLLLTGLLAATSLVVVALAAWAAVLVTGVTAGVVWSLRRLRVAELARAGAVSTARASRQAERLRPDLREARRRGRRLWSGARASAAVAPGRAQTLLDSALQNYARLVYRLTPGAVGRSRAALELNELGAQLRREGAHEQAAEQHRVALEIVRDLGDEQAEALTLNNLALALAHGGAEEAAVEHLEEALVVLRKLGDEAHEGRVIANLGLVHRRQGHSEEAVSLLHEALDKLPPGSSAYRQVEEELLRAS
jgi:tetratricopeptide (TPR) repeat protein